MNTPTPTSPFATTDGFIDWAIFAGLSWVLPPLFHKDPKPFGPSLTEQIQDTQLAPLLFEDHNKPRIVRVPTTSGLLKAVWKLEHWRGTSFPTVIYHHGTGECGPSQTFKAIFTRPQAPPAMNLITVTAPFHTSFKRFLEGSSSLPKWISMMATSVALIDALVHTLRTFCKGPIAVCGLSLGGYIANLHHIHRSTADLTIPLLAGGQLAEVYLELTARFRPRRRDLLAHADAIRDDLNFGEHLTSGDTHKIRPLLAQFDQIVAYHHEVPWYDPDRLTTIPKGHITSVRTPELLFDHIVEQL